MLNKAEINDLIASDKKELTKFILDLCGFTLDEVGYKPEAYAFYLHIAFRRQSILQKQEWDKICADVLKTPLAWDDNSEGLRNRVRKFAKDIVNEVHNAHKDELPIKILKTSYYNKLDKARKASEEAAKFINSTADESLNLSSLDPRKITDRATRTYYSALKAHVNYLDSLLALPFVLEKICLIIANNTGENFEPNKTAEMLAQTLGLLQKSLAVNKFPGQEVIQVLKIAVPFLDIDLSLDDPSVNAIKNELLPFLNQLLKNYQALENKKAKLSILHPDSKDADKASKLLLESLDVRFESLQEILCQTLLHPIEECNRALTAAGNLASNLQNLAQRDNRVDQLVDIGNAFAHFYEIVNLCNTAEQSILPAWLQQSNQYYQQLKDTSNQIGSVAKATLGSLGAFYNYTLAFIPKAISNYLTSAAPLSQILQKTQCKLTEQEAKKIMVYFAFYELIKNSGIQGPLEPKFFAAYMQGIFKKDKNFNEGTSFRYEDYKALEEQLDKKEDLDKPLIKRLKSDKFDPTASFQYALEKNGLTAEALDIFLLIHRLNTLENQFNPENLVDIFKELEKACSFLRAGAGAGALVFREYFLYPTLGRLFARYNEEHLIPLLEHILDSKIEEHLGHIHLTRELYFKLKRKEAWSENDWNIFKVIWEKEEGNQATFAWAKRIASLAPRTDSPDDNASCLTPKEIRRNETRTTAKALIPHIKGILCLMQKQLDAQTQACLSLQQLINNDKINNLCNKKLNYINKINELINLFRAELKDDAIRQYITRLLDNPDPIELLANPESLLAELQDQITNFCTPSRLIRLAWHVLPANIQSSTPISESFLGNLFDYYFNKTKLQAIKDAEQAYSASLNENPIPALIKSLNNPLALANLIPAQEKIMDVLIDKLMVESGQTISSWGVNYIKAAVVSITKENLTQLLPYPFLANLAIQTLQSQALQEQIAPMLNSLKVKCIGATEQISAQFKEVAKQQLYPILGIEIQKTIEAGALSYAQNPEQATATEQSSFAMYYLQYRELKQDENQSRVVKFLFSELLKDKTEPEKQKLINKLIEAFTTLDDQLQDLPASVEDPLEKTKAQLKFLIESLDCSDPDNNVLIKLTLVNNLLLLVMDTAEELNDQDKILKLQEQAIEQLDDALNTILQQAQDIVIEGNIFIDLEKPSSADMYQTLATANQRVSKKQLERVKASLAQTKTFVDTQIRIRQNMLNVGAKKPLFNKSYAEWRYNVSKPARRVALLFSKLYEAFCFLFIWTAILSPILAGSGVLQTLFVSIGIAGAVGATATATGAILVGALLLVRLAVKLTKEIWNRRREFQEIQENPSLAARIGLTFLFSLKCLTIAVAKTLLTDYLVARLTTLLAFGPLASLRRAIRVWPSKEQVETEKTLLETLNRELAALDVLIDEQLQFIEKKAGAGDQSEAIKGQLTLVKTTLKGASNALKSVKPNDARYNRGYKEMPGRCDQNFNALKKELALLKTLQQAQKPPANEPNIERPAVLQAQPADKPQLEKLEIKLEAYKDRQKTIPSVPEQHSYLSLFWGMSRPVTGPNALQAELKKPLSESSFFVVPKDKELSDEELSKLAESFIILDEEDIDLLLGSSIFDSSQGEKAKLDQNGQQHYYSGTQGPGPTIFQPNVDLDNSHSITRNKTPPLAADEPTTKDLPRLKRSFTKV